MVGQGGAFCCDRIHLSVFIVSLRVRPLQQKKHREKAKTFSRCHSAAAISATKLSIFPYFIRIVIGESASAF